MCLQTVDECSPLVRRITPQMILGGRGAGTRQVPKAKVQIVGAILSGDSAPRPTLRPPHFSTGCRLDPTMGLDKKTASDQFKDWWKTLNPEDITIFSDGSEQYDESDKYVGYGYAVYQGGKQISSGCGSINTSSLGQDLSTRFGTHPTCADDAFGDVSTALQLFAASVPRTTRYRPRS